MNRGYENRLAEITAKRKKRKLIYKVLACVSCLVVGVTAFAMMTPAITMEKQDDQAASAAIVAAEEQVHDTALTDGEEGQDDVSNEQKAIDDSNESGLAEADQTTEQAGGQTEGESVQGTESGQETGQENPQNPGNGTDQAQNPGNGLEQESALDGPNDTNGSDDTDSTDDTDNSDVRAVTENQGNAESDTLTIINTIDNSETTGRDPSESQEFVFSLKLKSGTEPLAAAELPYSRGEENGVLTFDANGEALITLKHNETFAVTGLPDDTTWHVIAEPCAGYLTDHRIEGGDIIDGGNTGEQQLTAYTNVEYINSEADYTLPETGGPGTLLFVLGGCLMILGAGGALLIRRREYEA